MIISFVVSLSIYSNAGNILGKSAARSVIDDVKATATSQTDSTVRASTSFSAQVMTLGVSVSISPSLQTGFNGTTLTYTVTVNNTGDVADSYSLSVTDNALPSWSPRLLETSLSIPAGGKEEATLLVAIPWSAVDGTVDNITVVATSQIDNTVSGSSGCTAQAIADVSVFIYPSSQSGADNATLTYTVTIINISNVSDTFSISVSDNSGWEPTVSPTSFVLAAKYSNISTLSVTIPSGTVGGTSDNITVTATSQTDNIMSASESCTTLARKLGVSILVSPSSQIGATGARLTYETTVNNNGNVDDNYSLSVKDNAFPSWSLSVLSTPLSVSAGGSENVKLSVTIPSGAASGTVDGITVTATSQTDNTVSDSASFKAVAAASGGISILVYVLTVVVVVTIITAILVMKRSGRILHIKAHGNPTQR